MLADEDNITMEWIEIDPEAFTGTTVKHISVCDSVKCLRDVKGMVRPKMKILSNNIPF